MIKSTAEVEGLIILGSRPYVATYCAECDRPIYRQPGTRWYHLETFSTLCDDGQVDQPGGRTWEYSSDRHHTGPTASPQSPIAYPRIHEDPW